MGDLPVTLYTVFLPLHSQCLGPSLPLLFQTELSHCTPSPTYFIHYYQTVKVLSLNQSMWIFFFFLQITNLISTQSPTMQLVHLVFWHFCQHQHQHHPRSTAEDSLWPKHFQLLDCPQLAICVMSFIWWLKTLEFILQKRGGKTNSNYFYIFYIYIYIIFIFFSATVKLENVENYFFVTVYKH